MLNLGDYNIFSDLFSVYFKTVGHLNLKLRIFSGYVASFKIGVLKVQDLGNFELSSIDYCNKCFHGELRKNGLSVFR